MTYLNKYPCVCTHAFTDHEEGDSNGRCVRHGCVCLSYMQVKKADMEHLIRIPVNKLLFKPNAPAGMNPFVLMSEAYFYRSGVEDGRPIDVKIEGDNYRIQDGRHRVVASMLAGRPDVLAKVVYD